MGTIVCILALLLAGHGLGLIIKMRMFCLLIKRVETKYIKKMDGIVVDVDTYVKDGKLPILLWRISHNFHITRKIFI